MWWIVIYVFIFIHIYYTNMTSLWGCQHDCLPRVSDVTLGLRPGVTILTKGSLSCWQPLLCWQCGLRHRH